MTNILEAIVNIANNPTVPKDIYEKYLRNEL